MDRDGDAPSPPTDHVLRPHHLTLLVAISAAFRESTIQKLPSTYALHVHRVLLSEVAEVAQPRTHQSVIDELCVLVSSRHYGGACDKFRNELRTIPQTLITIDKIIDFVTGIASLTATKNDETPKLHRRSIFGFFCRRCQTTFSKLSAAAQLTLCQDYRKWCAGTAITGYNLHPKDELASDHLLFKTQADKKAWAQPHYFEAWQKSYVDGDENNAVENIRRFFEQHFHENSDSGYRHHALLGLIRMHYVKREYMAARRLVNEAIYAARIDGDKPTLHHCMSLLHRLPKENSTQRPVIQEIQSDLHPLEILFDVSKLLAEENEQPLNAAFQRIFQGIGLYDHWLDVQMAIPVENQQWAQHAVQSIVWREAGCHKLALVQEHIVLAFTEFGGEDPTRLSIVLNRAYTRARNGSYDTALAFLLDPSVWRGLAVHDYTTWSHQIWNILALRTARRGQLRMLNEFLLPRRPPGLFNPKEYMIIGDESGTLSPIREALYRIVRARENDQVTSSLNQLLNALWHSEFLCRFGLYRTAVIFLADVSLEFGMSKRCRQVIEDVMPQIIDGDDMEQRAVACFTLARCIIASESSSVEALTESVMWLVMAEDDFRKLEMYKSVKDVLYVLSVVYHNLGMLDKRDEAATKHAEADELLQKLEMITFDETYQDIFQAMADIGAALAVKA